MNNISIIPDELWDHYSGLPNPLWYEYITEVEDEKEDTADNVDTTVTNG